MTTSFTSGKTTILGVGFRYSPYGQERNPGAEYWLRVGQEMVNRFPGAKPEAIWIVSVLEGAGTHLTFPGSCDDPLISFASQDENEHVLELFDEMGLRLWLQVEPGNSKVETLFDLILERYKNHPCVVGVGVDVEWHHSAKEPEGEPVGESEATSWLRAARAHGAQFGMFLKHWETAWMPLSYPDGIRFVDDSQMFASLEQMVAEFVQWGKHFFPAPVAYQIGYPADKKWWAEFRDPAKVIGEAILRAVPNAEAIYWVNFTAQEVFPP
jgi:hypothetical protein